MESIMQKTKDSYSFTSSTMNIRILHENTSTKLPQLLFCILMARENPNRK